MDSSNIFIVGSMGSGKSSIGKILAKKVNRKFIDTDNEIINIMGCNITEIFQKYGEEYFRELETKELNKCQPEVNLVISTGGGIILRRENINIMKESGHIIFLDIDVDTQLKRLKNKKNRPLLSNKDLKKELTNLKTERDKVYKEIADVIIKVSNKDKISIVKDIQSILYE
ncbi:MAG: shikimate kinase [Gammaproteobacteria bacterium]|nr:shikimate kinase [Gammaproteobacteria bacterium]|tara:strand:+ start:809 stop:1321 length:513 start_codon:yes stop_codon:yes gene_type:complete